MFRFKLRTLIIAIATALIGVFLGLQVHVHNKVNTLAHELLGRKMLSSDVLVERVRVLPVSMSDFLLLRRKCVVTESVPSESPKARRYRVPHLLRVNLFQNPSFRNYAER